MAFSNTLDSLSATVLAEVEDIVNNRIASSTEKVAVLTPSNNAVTIDPSSASLFKITCSSNTAISLEDIDEIYTNNGGTVSILLTRSSDSVVITWPNSITWNNGTAPTLSHIDMIILTTFDGDTTWVGNAITVDNTFPSE